MDLRLALLPMDVVEEEVELLDNRDEEDEEELREEGMLEVSNRTGMEVALKVEGSVTGIGTRSRERGMRVSTLLQIGNNLKKSNSLD